MELSSLGELEAITLTRRVGITSHKHPRHYWRGLAMSRYVLSIVAIGTIIVTTTSDSYAGVASFQGLGDIPGGSFNSIAWAVSSDGLVVVGESRSAFGTEAFRWTASGGIVRLGDLPGGGFSSGATDVSVDGSVVVGSSISASGSEVFRWNVDSGMVGLGDLAGGIFRSFATSVSADGSVIVGSGNSASGSEVFRWTPATGMVGLGDLPGGRFQGWASATAADGSVVVGKSSSTLSDESSSSSGFLEAFRWTAGDGMVGLGDLPGGIFDSEATATSADGSVVVGYGRTASGQEAFRWTVDDGMVGLGSLPDDYSSVANATSADGSVVVGSSTSEAFVWDQAYGTRSIADLLVNDFGLDLTGWTLKAATGISADGLTIVGQGTNPSGDPEAFIATIPEPGTLAVLGLGVPVLLRRFEGTDQSRGLA
jgi:probable HAF family extracellular repeat protein